MIRDPVEIAKNWRLFTVFTSPVLGMNGTLIQVPRHPVHKRVCGVKAFYQAVR